MSIDIFELERRQSLWENRVKFNLSESGVHPYSIQNLMNKEGQEQVLKLELGYGQTNGSIELRNAISHSDYVMRAPERPLIGDSGHS